MAKIKFDLIPWQKEVLKDKTRFHVIVAGRRCGKTRFSVVNTLIKALNCPVRDAGVMYVAPTQGMARVLCWNLLMQLGHKLISGSNVNNGEIKLANGVTIYVRGADSPDSLRGMKLWHVTLDEMQMMKDNVWELIIRPALSDMKGTALFIGTPNPGESLFRDYFDLGQSGSDVEWKSWHLTTMDNPLIDKKEIEAAKRSMSTMAFLQEYMASFDTMGSDIFKEEWFKYGPEPQGGSYYIAVDLAGFEDVSDPNKKKYLDDTAIAVVKVLEDGTWWVKKVESFRKDVRETAVRILMNIRTFKPVCVGIEKGSLMRAVMPYLKDLMNKHGLYAHIEPINTSGSSKKGVDAIANRVIFALQGRFEHGRIIFSENEDHSKLKEQLLLFPSKKAHDDLCFPAETPIITSNGIKPIVEVTIDDYVLTRNGFSKVLKAWCSGNKKVITRFGITATPEHKIWTENRGWVSLDSLRDSDTIIIAQPVEITSCVKQSSLMEENITDTLTQNNQIIIDITQATINGNQPQDCCTEIYGSSITEKFQKDTISTIKTGITTIMKSQTSSAYLVQHIKSNIEKKESKEQKQKNISNIWKISETSLKHGIHLQKEENGIDNMHLIQSEKIDQKNHVSSAEICSNQKSQNHQCVAISAKESELTNYKTKDGENLIPVYDLMIEGSHEFFAWGTLVHNCDALSLVAHLQDTAYFSPDESSNYEIIDDICGF